MRLHASSVEGKYRLAGGRLRPGGAWTCDIPGIDPRCTWDGPVPAGGPRRAPSLGACRCRAVSRFQRFAHVASLSVVPAMFWAVRSSPRQRLPGTIGAGRTAVHCRAGRRGWAWQCWL